MLIAAAIFAPDTGAGNLATQSTRAGWSAADGAVLALLLSVSAQEKR
jgi:hypothetical protein